MARNLIQAAALLLCAACATSQQNAGIAASFSEAGTQYLLNTLIPVLEKDFGSLTIPDIPWDQDGFEGSVSSIQCTGFTIGAGDIIMTAPSVLGGQLSNIAVSCTANWNFQLKSWPHLPKGSGSADIAVSQTTATVEVAMGVTSDGHASMASQTASITIGSIDISFHGSAWDWLLNLVKGLLTDSIKSSIESNFATTIASLVNKDGNAFLAGIPTELPIPVPAPYNMSEVRFGLTQAPAVTAQYAGVFLQGDVVPAAAPQPPAGVPPPSLPPFSPAAAASYVQLLLSPYTLLTAAGTYYDAGLTSLPIAPKDIPLGLNTTGAWAAIAPGLAKAYPPSTPVQINAAIDALPQASITAAGIAATVPASFTFLAMNGTAGGETAFVLASNVSLALALDTAPSPTTPGSLVITGTMSYLDASLVLASTAVGPVDVSLLASLVNITTTGVLLPIVNGLLAKGLPLPSAPGLTLTGALISYADGYVTLESNFTFVPPSVAAIQHAATACATRSHVLPVPVTGSLSLRGSAQAA